MQQKKNYLKWYRLKAELNRKEFTGNFSEREVWWCSVGVNIGNEQDGKNELFERPVLIFRKFGRLTFQGIPLSTTIRSGSYYHSISINETDGVLLLNQARLLSVKRLQRRMGRVTKDTFRDIQKAYLAITIPEIKSDPQKAGSPRAPSGEVYPDNSKDKHESQEKTKPPTESGESRAPSGEFSSSCDKFVSETQLKTSISVSHSPTEPPVPSGNLHPNSMKHKHESQESVS